MAVLGKKHAPALPEVATACEQGNEIIVSSPTQIGAFLIQESAKWVKAIKENNIQLE